MESLREWPRAFVPLHRGNVIVKNRAGSEGYLFFPRHGQKGDANTANAQRKKKKKKKTKQNKVGKAKQAVKWILSWRPVRLSREELRRKREHP